MAGRAGAGSPPRKWARSSLDAPRSRHPAVISAAFSQGACMMRGLTLDGEDPGPLTDDEGKEHRRIADRRAFDWLSFLTEYSKGGFPASYAPEPPPSYDPSAAPPTHPVPAFSTPLYSSIDPITPSVADDVQAFYDEYDFLPPPRAEDEPYREAVILEYDLYRHDQKANFDTATSLLQSIFGGICTFSLFRNRCQIVTSVSGNVDIKPGEIVTPETSLCGHCILRKDGKIMQVHDLAHDWRFRGNPWVVAGAVKGYVGLPITLPAGDEWDTSLPLPGPVSEKSIAVGVINVMPENRTTDLDEREIKVLQNVKTMLEGQIRATWSGWKRNKEARMRKAATSFIDRCLVDSQQRRSGGNLARDGLGQTTPGAPHESPRTRLAALAVKTIRSILPEVDFAAILDLAPIHVVKARGGGEGAAAADEYLVAQCIGSGHLLAFDAELTHGVKGGGSAKKKAERQKWEGIFESPQAWAAVAKRLDHHEKTGQMVFDPRLSQPSSGGAGTDPKPSAHRVSSYVNPSDTYSGLEPWLPDGVAAHLAMPFFSAEQPDILILLASRQSSISSFGRGEVAFVRNIGVALSANRVHQKLLIADKAKTTFLSSVSHELRTPLHGLLGQLDLIRNIATETGSAELDQLCTSARTCGLALQQILNDVLDFGKMSQESAAADDAAAGARETVEAIDQTVEQTAQMCVWQHQQRTGAMPSEDAERESAPVDVKVQIEDRSPGDWRASVDASGLQRVLLNLVTNSLKYTAQGLILVRLSTLDKNVDCRGRSLIQLKITDTGKGMDPAFLSRLFQPFTQADSFSPGAGLGLHITKTILARMDGSISVSSDVGVGSSFTVTLPVTFSDPRLPSRRARPSRTTEISTKPKLGRQPSMRDITNAPPVNGPTLSAESHPLDGPRVLVVDDDPISRRILIAILQQAKVPWAEAPNGQEALKIFATFKPTLIWTDVSMPEMDGISAASEMRQLEAKLGFPRCYIVAITGLGSSDPRTKMDALLGRAAIDEWRIKGQHGLEVFRNDIATRRTAAVNGS